MTFSSTLARLLWRGGFAATVTALALAACGGGDSIEAFRPNRILAFGDETSAFVTGAAASVAQPAASVASTAALKYSVNAVNVNASSPD
jgi:outer membrane lipase/esterase